MIGLVIAHQFIKVSSNQETDQYKYITCGSYCSSRYVTRQIYKKFCINLLRITYIQCVYVYTHDSSIGNGLL